MEVEGAKITKGPQQGAPAATGDFAYLTVPRAVGGKDSVRGYVRAKDGQERAEVTLPPGTVVRLARTEADASFYKLHVNAAQVRAWENDQGHYSVALPRSDAEGRPRQALLVRETGHWENPEAQGAERGKWVPEETKRIRVDPDALAEALQRSREERREYARAHERDRAEGRPALKEEGAGAARAAEALASEPRRGGQQMAQAL